MAATPTISSQPKSATYRQNTAANTLYIIASTADPTGILTYQWQQSTDFGVSWTNISGATSSTLEISTLTVGTKYYRCTVTNTLWEGVMPSNTLYPSDTLYPGETTSTTANTTSEAAIITILDLLVVDYMKALRNPFIKLCRLRFLNPNGTVAFAVDNNTLNPLSKTFIAEGSISANFQNGKRRSVSVTLDNVDGTYNYNVNHLWFGTEIAVDEGMILPDGTEYYIQQGVFVPVNPQNTIDPETRTITYTLEDKWANLDGTLYGNLDSAHEVAIGTNVFTPITALLVEDRGNGRAVDATTPVYTDYYNDKTQTLPDGTTVYLNVTPYTLTVDSDSGTIADVILGLVEMFNGVVGYDVTGALRIEPSQDDIEDGEKPIQWAFGMDEVTLLGMAYDVKNTEVYNDYIVIGDSLSNGSQAKGRAQNLDPASPTNIYAIGRKTIRVSQSGYYTDKQCQDYAAWKLKRSAILQQAVSISCSQILHLDVNNVVTIRRTDKPGNPVERHLITSFTRPLASNGEMTINATSVNDMPIATIV